MRGEPRARCACPGCVREGGSGRGIGLVALLARRQRRVGVDLEPDVLGDVGDVVADAFEVLGDEQQRSEEHTSELQSLMRISYAVFCLKTKTPNTITLQLYI